jgi:HEAT repeat protein
MTCRILSALAILSTLSFAGEPAAVDAKARVAALKAALKSGTDEEKHAAIRECGSTPHAMTAGVLASVLSDPSDALRISAAQALGSMKEVPEASKVLGAGVPANAKKPEVLKAIFKGMSELGQAGAVPALKEYLAKRIPMNDDKESGTVCAAIETLAKIRWKAAVDVMVDLTEKQVGIGMGCSEGHHGPVFSALKRGMLDFSGKEFGMPGEPRAWWKKAQKDLNDDLTAKKK